METYGYARQRETLNYLCIQEQALDRCFTILKTIFDHVKITPQREVTEKKSKIRANQEG